MESLAQHLNREADLKWIETQKQSFLKSMEMADDYNDMYDDFSMPVQQPIVKETKIYPNDPCPCGSGKNIKNAVVGGKHMITREKLKKLNKENLIELILEMSELLNENQNRKCNQIVAGYLTDQSVNSHDGVQARMSDEFVSEKMAQIKIWIQQIDEGELYLNADEYEDYSSGYWDSDLITEYYDEQGIGDKINTMLRFAKDCVDDRKYQEASLIYEWIWEMEVFAEEEYVDPADLEVLVEKK